MTAILQAHWLKIQRSCAMRARTTDLLLLYKSVARTRGQNYTMKLIYPQVTSKRRPYFWVICITTLHLKPIKFCASCTIHLQIYTGSLIHMCKKFTINYFGRRWQMKQIHIEAQKSIIQRNNSAYLKNCRITALQRLQEKNHWNKNTLSCSHYKNHLCHTC